VAIAQIIRLASATCATSCPNERTSGEGLKEYWSSGIFSAALRM
jgi:hypothetical protein